MFTLSSARRGRCRRISMGSVSAAMTTNSEMPRFRVLVAAKQTGKILANEDVRETETAVLLYDRICYLR